MNDQIILSFVLCAIGWLGHVMTKFVEHRQDADPRCALTYYIRIVAPGQVALSLLMSLGAVLTLYGMGWLNPAAGLTTGLSANSIVDNIKKRALGAKP